MHLYSQLIQAETGDVIKQTLRCNQVVTITEQVTAVDNFKQYLAHELEHLQEDIARCANEGNTRLHAYVHEVIVQIRREYGTIHADFRHDVDEALNAFMRALDPSLQALHLPTPMRFL